MTVHSTEMRKDESGLGLGDSAWLDPAPLPSNKQAYLLDRFWKRAMSQKRYERC